MSIFTLKDIASSNVGEIIAGIRNIINALPAKDEVSDTLSPGTIVDGRQKFDMSVRRIIFVSFAFIKVGITNTMK